MQRLVVVLAALVAAALGATPGPAHAQDNWPLKHMSSTTACVQTDFPVRGSGWKIHRAIEVWNRSQTVVRLTTQEEPGCAHIRIHQYRADDDAAAYTTYSSMVFPTNGSPWTYSEVDIYLNQRYLVEWHTPLLSRATVAHELGHALGLGHNASSRSIVSYRYNVDRWRAQTINPVDARDLRLLYSTAQ